MRMLCTLMLTGLLTASHTLAQDQSGFQIRSYAVPVEHQGTLESILGEAVSLALGMGAVRSSTGVSSPAPGMIVVTAPAEIHEDIVRFLADFEPAEPVNVRTEYWIISGEAGPGAPEGPELNGLTDVLNTITQAQGEMTFALIEHAEIVAQAGPTAVLGIHHGEVAQTLNYQGRKIIGRIELVFRGSELSTELTMDPGQFIVLGRSSLPPPPISGTSVPPDQNQDMFFIVRSQID